MMIIVLMFKTVSAEGWRLSGGDRSTGWQGLRYNKGEFLVGNSPSGRRDASAVLGENGLMWFFGGTSSLGSWNDLWVYNTSSSLWAWMAGPADPDICGNYTDRGNQSDYSFPGSRDSASMWYLDGAIWIFGGYGFSQADPGILRSNNFNGRFT